jgi:hypothetical protein
MRLMPVIALLVGLALIAGCSNPVPPEKASYVGHWQNQSVSLLITAEGRVEYRKVRGSTTTSLKAPLKEFSGDNFEAGLGPLSTTFVVSKPPYQEHGVWRMVVDGEVLIRRQAGGW